MKKNLKALGLVIAAVFAMGALTSAAQAADFSSEAAETNISGEQTNTHHFSNGTFDVTCSSAEFNGTQEGETAEEVTIDPTYSGCHVIILFTFSATTNFNSCDYEFNANGNVSIKCDEEGDAISLSYAGCTLRYGEQTIEGAVSYENAKGAINVTANAEGIAYSQSGSTCGTAEGENGTYTGTVTVSGEDAGTGEPTNIAWNE